MISTRENVSNSLVAELVRSFGSIHLRVLGTSMAPSVLPGDLIFVRRVEIDEISVGEIVLFSHYGRLFAHRVISALGAQPYLITSGDRLGHPDPAVTPSDFLGRVVSIERGGRRIEPDTDANRSTRLMPRILRSSELATRAYLRLVNPARNTFSGVDCRP